MTQDYMIFDSNEPSSKTNSAPLSVSAALDLAKHALEGITISIVGEISDLSDNPRYKAVYFTLADAGAALACLMWRSSFDRLGIVLKSGMQVEVRGRFSLYSAKGRMQFDVRELTLAGEGQLRAQVAQLANRLRAQGLMDASRKLPLPRLPERIALITSPRGKAVHDVLRTLKRRYPLAKVMLYGVGVEGRTAAAGIIQALKAAAQSEAEVILLVRGGGSYEDLMPFNDEQLALALAAIDKPVITGIGHEPDNSIADMVASFRASTPTAAAEAAAPDVQELLSQLKAQQGSLGVALARSVEYYRQSLEAWQHSVAFTQQSFLLGQLVLNLEQTTQRLDRAIPTGLATAQATVRDAHQQLDKAVRATLTAQATALKQTRQLFRQRRTILTDTHANSLATAAARLESLSPVAVLSRGYALVFDAEQKLLGSAGKFETDARINIRLHDGNVEAKVTRREMIEGKDHE